MYKYSVKKDVEWSLDFRSRQSCKTKELMEIIFRYPNNKVLYVGFNQSNTIDLAKRYSRMKYNFGEREDVVFVSASNAADTSFRINEYSVVLLDEFDYYNPEHQEKIINTLKAHKGEFLRVFGLSSPKEPMFQTFRDLFK